MQAELNQIIKTLEEFRQEKYRKIKIRLLIILTVYFVCYVGIVFIWGSFTDFLNHIENELRSGNKHVAYLVILPSSGLIAWTVISIYSPIHKYHTMLKKKLFSKIIYLFGNYDYAPTFGIAEKISKIYQFLKNTINIMHQTIFQANFKILNLNFLG